MSLDYYFRPLGLNDLTDMMQIEREVFELPWSAGQMKDSLLAAHCQTWGICSEQTGEIMGFAVLSLVLDEVELLTLSISSSFHRQGYGEKLLKFLLDKAQEAKAEKVFLEVPEFNQAAMNLYLKCGFFKIGSREKYYPSLNQDQARENAVLMKLVL